MTARLFLAGVLAVILAGCNASGSNKAGFWNLKSDSSGKSSKVQQSAYLRNRTGTKDPYTRPRSLPALFEQEPWQDRIPLLGYGDGVYSSDFGWRQLLGRPDFHGGVDIKTSPGTPVLSTTDGTVVWINRSGYQGGLVVQGDDGWLYSFWHTYPDTGLALGSRISNGQVVAYVANAGSGSHLHYSIHEVSNWKDRSDYNAIDPIEVHGTYDRLTYVDTPTYMTSLRY